MITEYYCDLQNTAFNGNYQIILIVMSRHFRALLHDPSIDWWPRWYPDRKWTKTFNKRLLKKEKHVYNGRINVILFYTRICDK